jgi:hypothetical protein
MLRAAEGSSSTSLSALTSSGAATLCNGMYGYLCLYVCMYVCMYVLIVVANRWFSIHTYTI